MNCRVSTFSCNVYFVYLQNRYVYSCILKKSCIFVYNRVFFLKNQKKIRKFEFQFTHYKPKFPCFLATYGFFYWRIISYIKKIAFRLLLSLLEWLKLQRSVFGSIHAIQFLRSIATFMRSIQILCNFVYFVYVSKSCIV